MTRTRGFPFTINNYTTADLEVLRSIPEGKKGLQVRYLIWGYEIGDSGTPHIQGYVYFHNTKKLPQVVEFLGGRAHVAEQHGTPEENRAYCSKTEDFTEFGDLPTQGKRTDIEAIKQMVAGGATLREIYKAASSYQSVRMAEIGLKLAPLCPRDPPIIEWFWGPTGKGKTREAWNVCGYEDTWVSPPGKLQWFDGYDGQANVIFDDFRDSHCEFATMLRLTDLYPLRVPVKGGFVRWVPRRIIITSSRAPDCMYAGVGEDRMQLLRRIKNTKFFGDPDPEVGGNSSPLPHLPDAAPKF